jgi:hypothetical protein
MSRRDCVFAAGCASIVLVMTSQAPQARAQASVHDKLMSLAQEVTFASARLHPMEATSLGISGYDGELGLPTEASRASYVEQLRRWQGRLGAIAADFNPATELSERDDARLLEAQLTRKVDELIVSQPDRKDYSDSGNQVIEALYTQFENLPVVGQEGATPQDLNRAWQDIVSRLRKVRAYISAARKLVTMPCHLYGVIGSKELEGAPQFLKGPLTEAAAGYLGKGGSEYRHFLQARDEAVAALGELRTYIESNAASWPENYALGADSYDRMLKEEQLLPFTARDIEQIGSDALAHGWAEKLWLEAVSQRTSAALGATSGGGIAPDGSALVGYYRERLADIRKFIVARQVVTIPTWLGEVSVVETPAFRQPVQPTAAMAAPRLFSHSATGYYYVTPSHSLKEAAARLDITENFDRDRIMFTAAHEAMPGHFLQMSIARRHPNFIRKTADSTSFIEGWAFYGQEMFIRLGLYGADLDARLSAAEWERVDGAVAIADPKLASGEWSFQQTVDYLAGQTSFTREAVEGVVSMMARSPGYVIAYAVGRLQIENVMADYTVRMGDRASLQDFHDRLLSYGSTPLSIVGPELLADLGKSASEVRSAANY